MPRSAHPAGPSPLRLAYESARRLLPGPAARAAAAAALLGLVLLVWAQGAVGIL